MRLSLRITGVAIAAGLSFGGTYSDPRVDTAASVLPRPCETPLAGWRDLAAAPGRWLGRRVRLRFQFHSHVVDWNPYLTRFGSGQFVAVQGWADEQFPWVEADYDAPAVRLFARKDAAAARLLADAKAFGRFEARGVVRESFLGLPWIEIDEAQTIAEQVTEATVIHAAKAIELMRQKAWRLAELELEQAISAPLPDAALIEIERLRQACHDRTPAQGS